MKDNQIKYVCAKNQNQNQILPVKTGRKLQSPNHHIYSRGEGLGYIVRVVRQKKILYLGWSPTLEGAKEIRDKYFSDPSWQK